MLDCIIVGGGPAGMAAAVYFARQKLNFILLTKTLGGYALWSEDVENYLGFHLLNGSDLVAKFKEHLKDYAGQFEIHEDEPVDKIEKIDGGFRVITEKSSYDTKSLLIATGTKHRELGVPGEKEFYGKGVTYCATCDAPIFKDKKVFVIGGGNSAMSAALLLEKYTTNIGIATVNSELQGDGAKKASVLASKDITVYPSTKTTKIVGDDHVTSIGLVGPDGVTHDEPAEGVFVEIGLEPVSQFIDFVVKDKRKQIVVDKRNRTSVEGIYAAGDVTDVTEKQIAISVGEGSKAALEMIQWLQSV